MQQIAAGVLGFGGAVGLAAVFADVDPWRCGLSLVLAAIALIPSVHPVARVVLAALAALPVLDAGAHLGGVWALLALATVSAVGPGWKARLWVAGPLGVLAIGLGAWGGPAIVAAVASLVALGTPATRWAAGAVVAAGGVALVQAVDLSWRAVGMPLPEAAHVVARAQAQRLFPILEHRGLAALAAGDLQGARAVVEALPGSRPVGELMARTYGVGQALDAGWDPDERLLPEVAVALAWALQDRGDGEHARDVLARQDDPLSALHLAALVAEQTGVPQVPKGFLPADVPEVPGVVFEGSTGGGEGGSEVVWAPHGLGTLQIEGQGRDLLGGPELIVTVAHERWGPVTVERDGRWAWEVGLGPGAWRIRWELDPLGGGGIDASTIGLTIEGI